MICRERNVKATRLFVAVFCAAFLSRPLPASDWLGWRGPHGNGTAEDGADPPIEFGPSHNVVWRAAVPGRGHSSPIV
ncbi:MAG: serine/threonine protein kinase, partial [Planctomycetota bacterium]